MDLFWWLSFIICGSRWWGRVGYGLLWGVSNGGAESDDMDQVNPRRNVQCGLSNLSCNCGHSSISNPLITIPNSVALGRQLDFGLPRRCWHANMDPVWWRRHTTWVVWYGPWWRHHLWILWWTKPKLVVLTSTLLYSEPKHSLIHWKKSQLKTTSMPISYLPVENSW